VITSYSEETGFIALNNTGQIIEDGIGGLWMLTTGKLIRIQKQQLNDIAAGKSLTITPTLFDKFDGIAISSKASNSRNCRTKDGKIWVPTAGGIVVVTPNDIPLNPLVPSVMIESVALDDESREHNTFPENGSLRVAAGTKKFSFTFTALSFIAPERIHFRVQLVGFDDKPFEVGKNKRSVEYTNLERGKTYQFRVTACNNDGVWNDQAAVVSLYLEPFFWETNWFYALCLLGIGGITYQGFRWRVRRLRAKAKVLQQMVAARTQELEQANEEIRRQVDIQGQQAQEIELANTALQEKNQMLEHLNTEKNEFLGIAAHDMKNPLAGMMMNVGLMRRHYNKMSAEELEKHFASLEHTIKRMSDIISNLLDINAIETGAMNLTLTEFDLVPIMQQPIQDYHDRAALKNITLHFSTDTAQVPVYADTSALAQVIDNLLSNAVKYSPQGKNVFVRLREIDSKVRIEIQDEGEGIAPKEMEKLFGKFVRLTARPTGGEDSTGLGLSIVKKLVEAMNGKVWCESQSGTELSASGTTFIVELPSAMAVL
jgi:signal transduction histidine kinase